MASVRRVLLMSRGGALDGEQRQLCYLATRFDRMRFEPLVILDQDGPTRDALHRGGVAVEVLPTRDWRRFPEALMRYTDAWRLTERARAWGAALVHASDRWKSPCALFAARRLEIPCVLHMRGPMAPRDMAKHGFRHAAAIIAISRRYQEDLAAAGLSARTHLVDDAVDTEHYRHDAAGRAALRREWGAGDRFVIGLIGRIEPFKRVLEFLETAALLPENVLCVVVGQPGAPDYMERVNAAAARLGKRVHFAGRRNDMPGVLSALDLLVSLSGGSVRFEAMACGTPVLSAQIDARPMVHTRHDETAWCVNSLDPQLIASGVRTLLTQPALRGRLAQTARAWVQEHLAARTLAAGTQEVYADVLAAAAERPESLGTLAKPRLQS